MAKAVIATLNEYGLRIGPDDPDVASLVKRLESELPNLEFVVDGKRARELLPRRVPGGVAMGEPVRQLVVGLIVPAATAATVHALIDVAVAWLRSLARQDRGTAKTVDICGPDGALLATVEVPRYRRRPRVRSLLPEDVRRRRRQRWFFAFGALVALAAFAVLLWNADVSWLVRGGVFSIAAMLVLAFAFLPLFAGDK